MATTMLAFSATIFINIELEKNKWTSSLTYGAAFFPVCIFAFGQFPLYVAIKGCVRSVLRRLKKLTPRFLLRHQVIVKITEEGIKFLMFTST
ncbi:hypothetical protein VNO77_44421 [Canavalia gladiata]|uniref:Uncharacterized protein n=1 Tax=Canavalia gladiata TaxID=3824 RepID=A0AAN9JY73_CANGL